MENTESVSHLCSYTGTSFVRVHYSQDRPVFKVDCLLTPHP